MDPFGNGPSVHRIALKGPQNKKIQGSLEEVKPCWVLHAVECQQHGPRCVALQLRPRRRAGLAVAICREGASNPWAASNAGHRRFSLAGLAFAVREGSSSYGHVEEHMVNVE